MEQKNVILSKDDIAKRITRLAYSIVEQNLNCKKIILAGIAPNGLGICKNLKSVINEIATLELEIIDIVIDKKNPKNVSIPNLDFNNQTIIIVDDVSMTGRTICYALNPFLQYYPTKIQTLVLVERQLKDFPIHSDYVGLHLSTTAQDLILVEQKDDILLSAYLQ